MLLSLCFLMFFVLCGVIFLFVSFWPWRSRIFFLRHLGLNVHFVLFRLFLIVCNKKCGERTLIHGTSEDKLPTSYIDRYNVVLKCHIQLECCYIREKNCDKVMSLNDFGIN